MSKIYKALERAEAEVRSGPLETLRPSNVLAAEPPEIDLPERREEYAKLKVMLTLEATRSDFKSVMLVSALSGEGVSTVSLGLAAAMAEGARQGVLMLDLNSASPALAGRLGLMPRLGLGELLAKEASATEAILESQIPHLFLLGQGRAAPDFSQPGALHLFEELLKALRSDFDYLIVDGGSLERSPDSLLVASRLDGVVLVVQAERTGADTVRDASGQLRAAGATLLGTVLNRRHEYLPDFLSRKL